MAALPALKAAVPVTFRPAAVCVIGPPLRTARLPEIWAWSRLSAPCANSWVAAPRRVTAPRRSLPDPFSVMTWLPASKLLAPVTVMLPRPWLIAPAVLCTSRLPLALMSWFSMTVWPRKLTLPPWSVPKVANGPLRLDRVRAAVPVLMLPVPIGR